jgi:hypothetical protein
MHKQIHCSACGKFVSKHGYIERDPVEDKIIDALCTECYIKELKCRVRCLAQRVVLAEEFLNLHNLLYDEDGVRAYEIVGVQSENQRCKKTNRDS